MTEHTPGKWMVAGRLACGAADDYEAIMDQTGRCIVKVLVQTAKNGKAAGIREAITNARFIAAGPRMFKALEYLHGQVTIPTVGPHDPGSQPDICYACAALTAAKGAQNDCN